MNRVFCLLLPLLMLSGCTKGSVDTPMTAPVTPDPTMNAASDVGGASIPATGMDTKLTPENTRIAFVGTHADKDPDPDARAGHFGDFEGLAVVADDELKSVSVQIQTSSVTTENEKLTNHLKSPDFFDVRSYPTARFVSKRIARNDDGDYIISGDLTLLGNTKEISFPARVGMADGKLTLSSDLKLNRGEFGMTEVPTVKDEVSLNITIGDSIASSSDDQQASNQRGGGPGGPGRGGRGNFDPAARFQQWDADGDGKLQGDEIPDRMRENLASVDTDGDQAITLEEMQGRFSQGAVALGVGVAAATEQTARSGRRDPNSRHGPEFPSLDGDDCHRFGRRRCIASPLFHAARSALAAAVVLGICVGYVALPDWAPLLPKFHWHWIPFLGVVAGVVGMLGGGPILAGRGQYLSLILVLFVVAAWLLTPDWEGLLPRPVLAAALAVYLAAVFLTPMALSRRLPALELLVYLFAVALAVAIGCAATVSLRYGQLGGMLALSLLGVLMASALGGVAVDELVSTLPCLAIYLGGLAFVTYIEPDPALPRLLLIPLTPVVLWMAPARLPGWQAVAMRAGIFGGTLAIVCGLALWS